MKYFLIAILALCLIAADLPPALPSSYYGTITGAGAGAIVTSNFAGSTIAFFAEGYGVIYSLNVTGGEDGAPVTIYVNGKAAGTAIYATGSNTNVNLIVPADVVKIRHGLKRTK